MLAKKNGKKRPPNGWHLFCKEQRPVLVSHFFRIMILFFLDDKNMMKRRKPYLDQAKELNVSQLIYLLI
jgi:hypothetical protein